MSAPAQTSEERRAAIDKRLDDSLGKFDRELQGEQERVARERDARSAANAGKGEEGKDASGSATPEGPASDSARSKSGDLHSDKAGEKSGDASSAQAGKPAEGGSAGGTRTIGSGAAAKNIPDGSDDDIVARRLRKAAEQETDPELKEKLWKEYIEYKKSAGKG
ncbi:MAG: hypothetical protein WCE48_01690 [Steroidobacteraceae bacterium]